MNNKILIAAFAGLSLFAAAQSQSDKQKPKPSTSQTQSPRDAASGQATGHLEQKNIVHRDLAARDVATGQASGNKTAQDDWQQTVAKPASSSSNPKPTHVATGDVNGDGAPDAVASKNSGHASEAAVSTTAASSKDDAARGQTTGKRQHQPITITKETDQASTRVATGDVNGDGTPDVAASKNSGHATEAAASTTTASSKDHAPRDAASGQSSGKRMHKPLTIVKEVDKTSPQ